MAVADIILDEVNVKEIEFVQGDMLVKKVKCNFRVMGKKYGKLMKGVAAAMSALSNNEIGRLEAAGKYDIEVEGQTLTVELADVEIVSEDIPGWTVASDGNLTVALDLTIDESLRRQGMARELVKRIQAYRKQAGFNLADRIRITLFADERITDAVADFGAYIKQQVLATEIATTSHAEGLDLSLKFGDFDLPVSIEKA